MRKFLVIVVSLIVILTMSSCDWRTRSINKINEVEPDVDYSFTAVYNGTLVKNSTKISFNEIAYEVFGKEGIAYNFKLLGHNMYFCYQFNIDGEMKEIDGETYNFHTFDVAFFKVNTENLNCELIYVFDDVYPTNNYKDKFPKFLSVVDENRAVIQYNGLIQVINLNSKYITDSIELYDKDLYRFDKENENYYFTTYGDYYVLNDDVLKYYKIDGYKFILQEYNVDLNSLYLERYENYIYTFCYQNYVRTYLNCYDLNTNESVDVQIVLKMVEENKSSFEHEKRIELNDTLYYIEEDYSKLIIKDENEKEFKIINEEYMKNNSEKFNKLYYLWNSSVKQYSNVRYYVADNKLFIGLYADYHWGANTPLYIYECDIENDVVKYVGYTEKTDFGYFYITN